MSNPQSEFGRELTALINRHSRENVSNTPDFILATYIGACLVAFEAAAIQRDAWHRDGVMHRLNPLSAPDAPRRRWGWGS